MTFRDRSGRVLFDLPDAPRPDPDTPAPVRFLPEYDNVLLSHADRSRFVADAARAELSAAPAPVKGTVLADGQGLGGWRLDRDRATSTATMAIQTITVVDRAVLDEVEAEAARLAAFMAPGAEALRRRDQPRLTRIWSPTFSISRTWVTRSPNETESDQMAARGTRGPGPANGRR